MYGLKSSGAAWQAQLSLPLKDMDFMPSLEDPDIWSHASSKPNRFCYYEYILVYVDDILVLSRNPTKPMRAIQLKYHLKEDPSPPRLT
jgi:hypothetical protein